MSTTTRPDKALDVEIAAWVTGRLPDGWFTGEPEVDVDRDEVLIVGVIPDVELDDAGDAALAAAREARLARFREDTRRGRIAIAEELQERTGRTVSWGATCGGVTATFTTLAVPVMTRLRMRQRAVLDTLIDAGVARSRSEALAWCVRLVGDNEAAWIANLREALVEVERVRSAGPEA